MVARQAARYGDRVYLTCLPDSLQVSYRDLHLITNRVANGLQSLGLGDKPHLALLMENCPEAVFALLAIGKLGGVAAPINAAARGDQLRYFVELSDAVAVIVEEALLGRLLEVLPSCPEIRAVVVVPSEPGAAPLPATAAERPLYDWTQLERFPDSDPGVEVRFDQLAMLAFTSGTTGPSKASMHTQAKCLLDSISNVESWHCTDRDVFFTALPAFHVSALHGALLLALVLGARVVMARRFSARSFWTDTRETGTTVVALLGSMTNILMAQPPRERDREHRLRIVRAVPMPAFHAEFEARFGCVLTCGYGLSDFGTVTSLPADAPASKKLSIGLCRPGWAVRIVDDDGFDVPAGEPGEIALRTDNLWEASLGYYRMPEATLEATRNGWFHTGDRARVDEDGYLYFVGRKKDAIRRRGENISAFEVEQIVQRHPAVAESAVFAVESRMSEDDVAVAVVLRPEARLSEAQLIEHCRRHMAYFMVPRYVKFVTELPRTTTQKVQKFRLKSDAEANPGEWWDRERAGIVITRAG
jgi:crotonobetaine/carnitine-CoA ligase